MNGCTEQDRNSEWHMKTYLKLATLAMVLIVPAWGYAADPMAGSIGNHQEAQQVEDLYLASALNVPDTWLTGARVEEFRRTGRDPARSLSFSVLL